MYSLAQIADISQAQYLQCVNKNMLIKYLQWDSRIIHHASSSIFLALSGSGRDGHQFIASAYDKGVRNFLIEKEIDIVRYPEANFLLVPKVLSAVQKIAQEHRKLMATEKVIAITGSNGKTIVKEWLSQVLQKKISICKNPKSYNSQLGVPISIWALKKENNIAIFEAGISTKNEMELLEKMIQPHIGIFTNLGNAHDAGFLNSAEKLDEKLKLFTHCHSIIYCADDAQVHAAMQKKFAKKSQLISWGKSEESSVQIVSIHKNQEQSEIKLAYEDKIFAIKVPFHDAAQLHNTITVATSILALNLDLHAFQKQFAELSAIHMRLELIQGVQQCLLINDSYSADLNSLPIALDFLQEQNLHSKKSIILSDFIDQGEDDYLYSEIFHLLNELQLSSIYFIGSQFEKRKNLFSTLAYPSFYYSDTKHFLKSESIHHFSNETILIKGARTFTFEKIIHRLEEKIHHTILAINLNHLLHNVQVYKSILQPKTKIMAMVKAFSYGSGSYEIANALQHYGVDYLAVAYVDEGVELRKKGIHIPIIVLNPSENDVDALLHYNLETEIYSLQLLQAVAKKLNAYQEPLTIHIKIDSGMHRLGFNTDSIKEAVALIANQPLLKVKSIFSHLAASDDAHFDYFTHEQAQYFEKIANEIEISLGYKILKHLCNSSAAVRFPQYQYDMVRLGIGMYGIETHEEIAKKLIPIASLSATVSQIHDVKIGESIGYSRARIASQAMRIATISIGYADGFLRAFGNGKGEVLVRGKRAKVVGNVCMDMCMIDITTIPDVQEGDTVLIFNDELKVSELASWANTIPYEIITGISQRIKRVYYKD